MADEIGRSSEEIAPDGNLPGDVMVSILTNLPIKSLMKFKSVSKPWCCLISSSRFSKLHLHRQSLVAPNTTNNCLMSLTNERLRNDCKYGILDLSRNHSIPADDDVLMLEVSPSLSPEQKGLSIIDSCNGLVCLGSYSIDSTDLILWNPATRRYRSIDLPKGDDLKFNCLGICYVDAIDDFKILVWNHNEHPSPVQTPNLYVYSLSSDSWGKLEYDNPKIAIHFSRPTYMFRRMHWLSNACPNSYDCTCTSATEILAFDVMDGAMTWYRLPVEIGRHGITLKKTLVIRGCLSVVLLRAGVYDDDGFAVRERGIEVWVMEEYGVEGSWVKRFRIQEDVTQLRIPFVSWVYGEIVIHSVKDASKVLTFYDPYSEKKSYLEFLFLSYRFAGLFNYMESLASVGNSLRGGT